MRKLILVDGNSVANRAFYAVRLLSTRGGLHTNAVYGFANMLLKLIEEERPTHFLVAFDAGKATFRHREYEAYKAGRLQTPPELSEQFPYIRELVRAFGVASGELEEYEADDMIGTLAKRAEAEGVDTLIVTGDRDLLQLVSDRVTVALTRKGITETERYDPARIREEYGFDPDRIRDLKGLMGDASDNLPGVPGVGEKTALKLLRQYGSLESVLEHASEIAGKLGENLRAHADAARLSKRLATIDCAVPLQSGWDWLRLGEPDRAALASLLRQLEFKSLLKRLGLDGTSADAGVDGVRSSARPADEKRPRAVAVAEEGVDVRCPDRPEEVEEALSRLEAAQSVVVEVTGDNPHDGEVRGVAWWDGHTAYFIPFERLVQSDMRPLADWLADARRPKRTHDSHRAEVALFWHGLAFRGTSFCTHIAAYLLDPTESRHTLADLSRRYGLPPVPEAEDVYGKGAKFKVPDRDTLARYVGRKAALVARLVPLLEADLEACGMRSLFYDLELPLSSELAVMETAGVRVDAAALAAYGEELREAAAKVEREIYELAGTTFNIGSTKQLGEILFDKLGLPVVKKTKTGYSTDADVLEELAPYHPIVEKILHYRQLTKLQSTYIEGLLKEIRPQTGKIHTYYQQTIAATGRLSSQFPNLQNIPIRLEEGRKIRKAFVPSEPGWLMLAADYSQIELRVLAHVSGDERLKEAFRTGMDIHTKTAMDVFGVSEDRVDARMRRQAKAVNFGIIYGISDFGLAQNLNISRKEAAEFIRQYFAVFSGVKAYRERIVEQARRDGYVTTLLGRRRYLPDINASNYNLRSFAERTAMNTPIQGTAADIIKTAMVRLTRRMRDVGLKSRMLLQVHDELVFEVPPDELDAMRELVTDVMESAVPLDVPLKVDVSWGADWYAAK